MNARAPFSVSQLTALVRGALSRVPELEDTLVEGEVSNLSRPASGHLYFTIKDAGASMRCVCFRGTLAMIPFRPENGMTVILHGRVDVYDQGGSYQLYVDRIEPGGIGALAMAVEQRKRELAAEGLFDERLKRPLPLLPRRVVVVTSLSGAALRDVCTVIRRRAPGVGIVVSPATVQGPDAAPAIVAAVQRAQSVPEADVVLIVRGGGSLEDLMAFNDVDVARAIRASRLPTVAGIGHETDTTIADMVADRRAPTPSAAAELAVPRAEELAASLEGKVVRLRQALRQDVAARHRLVDRLGARLDALSPLRRLAGWRQDLDLRTGRLRSALLAEIGQKRRVRDAAALRLRAAAPDRRLAVERERLGHRRDRLRRALLDAVALPAHRAGLEARAQRLEALSPLGVLARGYSITMDAATGAIVTAATATPGTRLRTRLADGEIESTVSRTDPT